MKTFAAPRLILSFLLVFCLFVGKSDARDASQTKITGMYTDMRYQEQTGDILGVEVFLVFSRSGYQIVFQDAEGSPSIPIVVSATVEKNRIEFDLPERGGYSGKFSGTIGPRGIVGRFLSGQENSFGKKTFELRRKPSYWQ